jgi:hypothetical protein
MKKRYVPILTFTVAMLLVGSIAYAADRRKKTKQASGESDKLAEEALQVELLSANEEHRQKKNYVAAKVEDSQLAELSDLATESGASHGH